MEKIFRIGVKRDTGTAYENFQLETEQVDGDRFVYGLDEAVTARFPDAVDWSFMTPAKRTIVKRDDGSTAAVYELL